MKIDSNNPLFGQLSSHYQVFNTA